MSAGNLTDDVQHRLSCFRRSVGDYIQVFIFHSIGPFNPSSITEINDLRLLPTDPEYISFHYGGSADKLCVYVKFTTQDLRGEEVTFVINNMKASEMGRCPESFQIHHKNSTCYFKLSLIDEATGKQILERMVSLQDVQESRVAVQMEDPHPQEEATYLGRLLNWVTKKL